MTYLSAPQISPSPSSPPCIQLTDALVLANDHVFISGTKTAAFPDGRYLKVFYETTRNTLI
jgi:hypothetical protein